MTTKEVKIPLLMGISLFMEMLDSTIVTTALPQIKKDLLIPTSNSSLIITAYMITVAIFIPLSGWLSRKYGNKNIWSSAIFIFIISSLGSGLSSSLVFMLTMRGLQGFSAALIVPTARLIVLENTPSKELLKMISYVIWPALIAPAIAPFIGGILTTYLSWRWIFMINIPIGIMLLIMGHKVLEKSLGQSKQITYFDWYGFISVALASASLLISLDTIGTQKSLNEFSSILLIIFVASIIFTVQHLKNTVQPLFSLSSLRFVSFKVSQLGGNMMWLTVGAIPYLSTLFFQNAFHWSPLKSGICILCIFIGNIGIKPIANNIIKSTGFKNTITISLVLIMITTVLIGLLSKHTNSIFSVVILIFSGIGRSLALTAYNGMSLVEVPFDERNSANTLSAVSQNLC